MKIREISLKIFKVAKPPRIGSDLCCIVRLSGSADVVKEVEEAVMKLCENEGYSIEYVMKNVEEGREAEVS